MESKLRSYVRKWHMIHFKWKTCKLLKMTAMKQLCFLMDWTRERKITEKWISSKQTGWIWYAASCQIKYIVWSSVFVKWTKIKEMDREHSRETHRPDTGPLTRPLDFDIDICRVTLRRLISRCLSIFTDSHYYVDEHVLFLTDIWYINCNSQRNHKIPI